MIVLDLPFPPSENTLWRVRARGSGSGRRNVYLSERYRTWLRHAEAAWLTAPREIRMRRIDGNFVAQILLDETRRRGIIDCHNYHKAALDLCQRIGVVENDRLADQVCVGWAAVEGCRIVLAPSGAAEFVLLSRKAI